MFAFDLPSTIQFKMPDWQGDFRLVGGWASDKATQVFSNFKAAVDPVSKEVGLIQKQTTGYIERAAGQAQAGFFGGLANIFGAGQNAVTAVKDSAAAVVSPLSSGLKWGVAIVVIGVALYVFLLVAPILPRRSAA